MGTFKVVSIVLGGFFVLSETVSGPDGYERKKFEEYIDKQLTLLQNVRRGFVSSPKFSGERFFINNGNNILVIKNPHKMHKTSTTSETRG